MNKELSKLNKIILDYCLHGSTIIKFIRQQILDNNLEKEFIPSLKEDLSIIEKNYLVISEKEYIQKTFEANFLKNYNLQNKVVKDLLIQNLSTFEDYNFKSPNNSRNKFLWYKDISPMTVSSFAYKLISVVLYATNNLGMNFSKYKSLYQINEGIEQAIFDFKDDVKNLVEYLKSL